ncbi:MAG TPA: hypothetical protein VGB64_14170 [Actinomycetota bacterium]
MDRPFPADDARTRQLLDRDFLYEHPESFRAGVLAAIEILAEQGSVSEHDAVAAARRARA